MLKRINRSDATNLYNFITKRHQRQKDLEGVFRSLVKKKGIMSGGEQETLRGIIKDDVEEAKSLAYLVDNGGRNE